MLVKNSSNLEERIRRVDREAVLREKEAFRTIVSLKRQGLGRARNTVCPRPEVVTKTPLDASLTWPLQQLSPPPATRLQFKVDRDAEGCATP